MLLNFLGFGGNVIASNGAAATAGSEQPNQHTDDGRLASSVGTEEAKNLAASYIEVDFVDSNEVAKPLFQITHGDGWSLPVRSLRVSFMIAHVGSTLSSTIEFETERWRQKYRRAVNVSVSIFLSLFKTRKRYNNSIT